MYALWSEREIRKALEGCYAKLMIAKSDPIKKSIHRKIDALEAELATRG